MHGFSDRIHHAFAFTAKHYVAAAPAGAVADYGAHPANVAVILARYGVDQATLIAGILHHPLEAAVPHERIGLERKISAKFGPVVLAVARDAVEPRWHENGTPLPWQMSHDALLAHLANADPRALDIIVADQLHATGTTITALRRLGVEYLRERTRATSAQTLWWYRSMLETLEARADWPHRTMLDELRALSTDLIRDLRSSEDTS